MLPSNTPGVYYQPLIVTPTEELPTGVPAFLGFADQDTVPVNTPRRLTSWQEFVVSFGGANPGNFLAYAVRGFFENGGTLCYAVRLDETIAATTATWQRGLDALAALNTVDLICAPDIMRALYHLRQQPPPTDDDQRSARATEIARLSQEIDSLQMMVLAHCDSLGDRFAILDARPGATADDAVDQRRRLQSRNGALYYPWVQIPQGPSLTGPPYLFCPPGGHVAGIYARSDERTGPHKAPANELLEGVVDLEINLTNAQQNVLNGQAINCLRIFPGRGIRVWGARTLSNDITDSGWRYINVRRLFLTVGRWIERNLMDVVFEPNDPQLWSRITRELTAYFNSLFEIGALKGRTAQEAFSIKCDAETNPPDVRARGQVITEISLAPTEPNEFILVTLNFDAQGVTITGPMQPGQ